MDDQNITKNIKFALRSKYSIDHGFISFEELSAYQIGSRRMCDVYAVGLWASTDFARYAFEIKVSRSDLMNELKDFSKSSVWHETSNYFYLTIPNIDLVNGLDIPESWGIMLVKNNRVKVIQKAKFREVELPHGLLTIIISKMLKTTISNELHQYTIDNLNKGMEEEIQRKVEYELSKKTDSKRIEKLERIDKLVSKYFDRIEWLDEKDFEERLIILKILYEGKYQELSDLCNRYIKASTEFSSEFSEFRNKLLDLHKIKKEENENIN